MAKKIIYSEVLKVCQFITYNAKYEVSECSAYWRSIVGICGLVFGTGMNDKFKKAYYAELLRIKEELESSWKMVEKTIKLPARTDTYRELVHKGDDITKKDWKKAKSLVYLSSDYGD